MLPCLMKKIKRRRMLWIDIIRKISKENKWIVARKALVTPNLSKKFAISLYPRKPNQ